MDVGDWLRSLGLGQYEAAFLENQIDSDLLKNLTAEDLKDLGVAIVGHRRKMLLAIEELSGSATAPTAQAETAVAPPEPRQSKFAERRQLTVMFCDLVGSTALAAQLDPEDMREIIAAYHKCCATLITGNGGFVAKYMGDGILAYFGYPRAHEDDAERAVQAGLATIEAVRRLENASGETLHVRVGIATGVAVVGDLIGSGESSERGVVGNTPNLAARLQSVAKPDSVVVAEATRKLLGDYLIWWIWARWSSRALRERRGFSLFLVLVPSRAASRQCMVERSPRLLGGTRKSSCCCAAGREQRRAKARLCFSRARQESANRG
jgi:class 3 adenylate cyclase